MFLFFMNRKSTKVLAVLLTALLTVAANAKDIPAGQSTEVTGTATLKDGRILSFNSSDTVVDSGARYPIKDMAVLYSGSGREQPASYKALLKAANT
jgi:hypothetical protein